jgi:hypothetical protein
MIDALPLRWLRLAFEWFPTVTTLVVGLGLGVALTTAWRTDHLSREDLAQIASHPTLHQRLDTIERRLQGIEERLLTSP